MVDFRSKVNWTHQRVTVLIIFGKWVATSRNVTLPILMKHNYCQNVSISKTEALPGLTLGVLISLRKPVSMGFCEACAA